MGHSRIGRRRVEAGLVRLASPHGLSHGVVDLEDHSLRPVLTVLLLVLSLDNGKGLHDVVRVVALDAIEVEVGGI